MTEDDRGFHLMPGQAPSAVAKQALMTADEVLGLFFYRQPYQLASEQQANYLLRTLRDEFGVTVKLRDYDRKTTGYLIVAGEPEPEMDRVQTAAAVLHYAEGTIGPVDFHPDGCATCARAVELVAQVDRTYPAPAGEREPVPVLLHENDVLGFVTGFALGRQGLAAAQRVSYRPDMLPAKE